jgi:hypothetical protein
MVRSSKRLYKIVRVIEKGDIKAGAYQSEQISFDQETT